MTRQALSPLPLEVGLNAKAKSTGTSHTLTVKVNSDLTVEISNGKLDIKNGDKVTWNVDPLPAGYTDWEPAIEFYGGRLSGKFTTKTSGSRQVEGEILGDDGSHQDSEELYHVILEKTGKSPVTLTYKSTLLLGDPDPCLVVDNIGDPPGGAPYERPWGRRRSRRYSA